MSTQRYISTSFWSDKWVRTLNPSGRYLYMYLLTNPMTNIAGVYQITLDRIAFDTGYDDRTLAPMLKEFAKAGKAYFHKDEWIILPSWPKHQKWQIKPTIKRGIDAVLESLPESLKKYMVGIGYQYPIVGYEYRPSYLDLDSDLDSDLDTDTDTDTDISTAKNPPPVSAEPSASAPDPLYQAVWQSFLSQGKFTNYGKEGKATKLICKYLRQREPDSPDELARNILDRFLQLTKSNDKFWCKQPFIPSALTALFDRVLAELKQPDYSVGWLDKYLGDT